jgi:hypothetical protein
LIDDCILIGRGSMQPNPGWYRKKQYNNLE